jgi:xanthine dehydrogenase/oxidase
VAKGSCRAWASCDSVMTDGSVLVTHGGVEMGQGLHTKLTQIAGQVLGVPARLVHIEETATDRVPNASPTAGSVSTDIYGAAVFNACTTLRERLQPFLSQDPPLCWEVSGSLPS